MTQPPVDVLSFVADRCWAAVSEKHLQQVFVEELEIDMPVAMNGCDFETQLALDLTMQYLRDLTAEEAERRARERCTTTEAEADVLQALQEFCSWRR